MKSISIRGARTHNLKNIDVDLPRDSLIVITGLSGSGKSSLAFDTLYAEGQRRYVESLSTYARQFLSMMEKPDVDHIEGLSPAIAIEQKSTSHNPRSTVGTVTEIHDYLRLLFARVGEPRCPQHNKPLAAQTISEMVDLVLAMPADRRMMLLAPVVRDSKGEHKEVLENLRSQGFVRARVDGNIIELDNLPKLALRKKHTIEAVVDRFKIRADLKQRLAESFEVALNMAEGIALVVAMDHDEDRLFSSRFACPVCNYSIAELVPKMFSFNNPVGACSHCSGLGVKQCVDPEKVVIHPEMSLAAGAIKGWDRRNMYYYKLMQSLAAHYSFDLDTPFHALPDNIKNVVLYGSGRQQIDFSYVGDRGNNVIRRHAFEGIIPNIERRYGETELTGMRDELASYHVIRDCPDCDGTRINQASRHVFIGEYSLPMISDLSIEEARQFFDTLSLSGKRGDIASKIILEIGRRLTFLIDVGLNYLSLSRSADTLSGGEAQRIRLASQIGAGLVGVMYVLDEPSIGLHQRDNKRLLATLMRLRDLGNTVIVVEHDEDAILSADYVLDIGLGAGVHGGDVVAKGSPKQIMKAKRSLTGQYLSGKRKIAIPKKRTAFQDGKTVAIRDASGHNLRGIDVEIPLGLLTCVTGVSGSGKSTLINDTLLKMACKALNGATDEPAAHADIVGLEMLDKVMAINQSPIGRTPRSNPATYTGIFTPVRELFASVPEARARGYGAGRFSFNVKGGRCESCQGDGLIKVEMHFLPDIYVMCDDCKGKRYNRETLDICYKGATISDVLNMTVEEASQFFAPIPIVARKLATLIDVGLAYIQLGQNATTLSGGEAQRIKLAKELSKRDTGNTLYVLDEPTTGLHFFDVEQLIKVLNRLRDRGNTVVVIEHNLDVIKIADWLIDMGPEGGSGGGRVVTVGTPEDVANCPHSHTGRYLANMVGAPLEH